MTIEKFKRLVEANGAYLVYFTDEYRVDVFKDGRSLGYVHLVKPNKAEWYGGPLANLLFLLYEFAETDPTERDYETYLIIELMDRWFDEQIEKRNAA